MIVQSHDIISAEDRRIRDAYARRRRTQRYSWLNPAYVHAIQEIERNFLDLLNASVSLPLNELRMLEVGCGDGHWLAQLAKWGADPAKLVGIDLLRERLVAGQAFCPPNISLASATLGALPFAAETFDVVLQITVFTSILDPRVKQTAASEMLRVVKRGGLILWYDFFMDNPRNPDVRGIGIHELRKLFPGCTVDVKRVTLAPPIARTIAPLSPVLTAILNAIPFLRTHYIGVINIGK